MKRRVLILLIIFATITTLGVQRYTSAKKPYYPEPQRSTKIPSHIKWNTNTGEYYNSKDFKWDEKTRKYIAIDMPINSNESLTNEHPLVTWLEDHKYSDDIIDKALIEYFSVPVDSKFGKASFYNPYNDTNLKKITSLGIENLPKMLKRIKSDKAVCSQLMSAVQVMTCTSAGFTDASDEGSNLWVLNLVEKAKNSHDIITNAHKKLKQEKNAEAINEIKKDISSLGIFGLPYAQDESKKGNNELINIFAEKFGEDFVNKDTDEIREVIETLKVDF